MKRLLILGLLVMTVMLCGSAVAQVTNLLVDGVSSGFTMASGDNISWSYNIPTGSSTDLEIWYDVNGNNIIEPGTDRQLFVFTQTDGQSTGNGPPDMDGLVNGAVSFAQPVGLAPGNYIMRLTNNSSSVTATGQVTPLDPGNVAFTVSGHVTPPTGKSAQYILVEVNRNDQHQPNFWDGITDASGNYTIKLTSDTAGNPWQLRLVTLFPPNVPVPPDTNIVIDGNKTGLNFSFISAAAQVTGYLYDENESPIVDNNVELMSNTDFFQVNGKSGIDGHFTVGLPLEALQGQTWTLTSANDYFTTNRLMAYLNLPVINSGDSLFRIIHAYSTNATIRGTVQYEGGIPPYPFFISGLSDSGQSNSQTDSASGQFVLNVSNKIWNYQINFGQLPPGVFPPNVTAHPGDSNLVLNITHTGVVERRPGIPAAFALRQNYPNPFNPVTDILYDIPHAGYVRLTVYNMLGQEVARLVDGEQSAGSYRAQFGAQHLTSGVYVYRLSAGTSIATRKMMLLK